MELKGKVSGYQIEKYFNLSNGYVNQYVKRNKVLKDEKGKIDLSEPINAEFINQLMTKHKPDQVRNNHTRKLHELNKEFKELGIEKRKQEIKLLKLLNQKERGLYLPADQIKNIFAQLGKTLVTDFYNSLENQIIILADKHGLKSEIVAELRKEAKEATNKAIKLSTVNLLKEIETMNST